MLYLLLIVIICFVWAVIAWKDWERAVLILPVFFPLYLFKIELGVPFNLTELMIYILFGIFLLKKKFTINLIVIKRNGIMIPLFFFILSSIAGVLIAPAEAMMINGDSVFPRIAALGIWKGWIMAPLIYFLLLMNLEKSKDKFKMAMDSLVVSGAYLSLIGIGQFVSGKYLTIDGRVSGPFASANYLSLYLAPIFIYLLIKVFSGEERKPWIYLAIAFFKKIFSKPVYHKESYFYWISLVLVSIALLLTKSYAGWLACFVVFIVYYLLSVKKTEIEKIIGVFMLIILFMGLISTQMNTEKFNSFLDFQGRSSSSVRLEVWQIAGSLIKDHPLLGIGMGRFKQLYNVSAPLILKRAPLEWEMLHPHNLLMAVWLNLGIVGLIAFIWMIVLVYRKGIKEGLNGRQNSLPFISLMMLTVILIHGFFDTAFWKNDLAMQWWVIMAGVLGIANAKK